MHQASFPATSSASNAKRQHHYAQQQPQFHRYAANNNHHSVTRQHQLHASSDRATTADVLARAQAIAQTQAQIQAQVQAYAQTGIYSHRQQPQHQPILYGQSLAQNAGFLSGSNFNNKMRAANAGMRPTTAATTSSQITPQQQTLHALHQRTALRTKAQAAATTSKASSTTSSSDNDTNNRAVEWRVAVDPKSKRPYYYHPITRETTWKKPQELVDKEKREKAQFFVAMENNIRSKLRAGNWPLNQQEDEDNNTVPYRHSDIGIPSSSRSSTSADSTRSSLSSLGRKQKPRVTMGGLITSKSAPNTPDYGSQPLKPTDNQDSTDDDDIDDEEDDDELTIAASKPPLLFRTLSSYETPVVMEKKTSGVVGQRLVTIPSPIQERVRLASAMQPRASDLESYAQSINRASEAEDGASATRQPLRRRSNSTSTIYVRMGTMNAPDQDCTIKCVATVLRAHMVEAAESPIEIDSKFDVFISRRERERRALAASLGVGGMYAVTNTNALPSSIPSLKEIAAVIKHVFSRAQMESECIIMSLIYVERLLKATSGSLQLLGYNWRSILFCSMVMASKVWDDLSMCNADFSKIWPELSLKEINELELAYLSAVEYNVRVSAVSYAKYYFHLRSMCASMGMLAAFDESAPLNLDGARKMQVLSEEYQERSKLMPAPRRRSVTITTTSIESSLAAASNQPISKPSPAASLEQLVQMQVRGAGGSSLSTMHRLSKN
uniref:WW domain-containing protein n=1 Tax=Globisporangium ultimum (strain ATCC 200006 / CBS 805.95 / DAOM BR144) TaxID=431595 RepID=K3X1X9_GLOUD